jgi:hypothetical protein
MIVYCALLIYYWLWNLIGREVLLFAHGLLVLRREVLGFGRSKEFDLNKVQALRVSTEPYNPWSSSVTFNFWTGANSMAFDYGARTYRLGLGLEEAEAGMVVKAIRKSVSLPEGA